MNPAVYLHAAHEGSVKRGHPWVFAKAVERESGTPSTGALVDVFSADNEKIGVGVYNEHSLYRVRLLAYAFESFEPKTIETILKHRLQQAIKLRHTLQLPNAETNAYRLVNSEGDGLSGLTIDRFNHTLIISCTAYWTMQHQDLITKTLQALLPELQMKWLPQQKSLAQDGWILDKPEPIDGHEEVMEAGVRFSVPFSETQKTGLFLDQRENHQRLAQLVSGKRVLDLYTYTGGFALHAAIAGAAHVTAVDSSKDAIEQAQKNANQNGVTHIEFLVDDARNYLTKAGDYDVVVLDPPKLVPSRKHVEKAKNYYRYLHREVLKVMQPGSLLLTCNCSSALSAKEFTELVSAQGSSVNQIVRIIGVYGPSSCHPILGSFPEGQYLTAVLLAIV